MTRDERVGQSIYSLIGLILHRNFDQQLTCGGDAVSQAATRLNLTSTSLISEEEEDLMNCFKVLVLIL